MTEVRKLGFDTGQDDQHSDKEEKSVIIVPDLTNPEETLQAFKNALVEARNTNPSDRKDVDIDLLSDLIEAGSEVAEKLRVLEKIGDIIKSALPEKIETPKRQLGFVVPQSDTKE